MFPALLTILLLFAFPADSAGTIHHRPSSANHHAPRIKVITLERTVCFGTCPVYKLTIYRDGRVRYEGIKFVKKKGKATGRINRAKVEELVEQFQEIYYFNLDEAYTPGKRGCPQALTDLPSALTSLTWNGRTKTVNHYHGCRGLNTLELLTQLEDKIDSAVNVGRWTK